MHFAHRAAAVDCRRGKKRECSAGGLHLISPDEAALQRDAVFLFYSRPSPTTNNHRRPTVAILQVKFLITVLSKRRAARGRTKLLSSIKKKSPQLGRGGGRGQTSAVDLRLVKHSSAPWGEREVCGRRGVGRRRWEGLAWDRLKRPPGRGFTR